MIHNIEDGKKKAGQRYDGGFSGYMTDEELMKLIGQVEAEEMLHAPVHLKGSVFGEIRRERREAKKRQVFVYRAKVLVAMAAAVAVLIFMPDGSVERVPAATKERQAEEESLAHIAKRREENRDSEWEKYVAERARGGIRGFFDDINEAVEKFGAKLQREGTEF